ncbi:MAG: metallophosphoesterase [Paludibacteraceae bacterium]|nr:metallophosphoesterase [Paludibacteraceae bacterium]
MINDFDLKSNQTISIFPIGDVHVGTPFFNKEYFEYMLHKFDTAQGIKIIYLLGDLLDCATKRLGQSAYQQVLSPEEQLDYMVKSLKPFKEHIRGCVIGNHEARFRKEFDLDIMKILADNLDIDYATEIYDKLIINDKDYIVWANHGTKTSQQQHLMQGAVMRQTQHIDANLYLYGHAHYLSNWSQVVKSGSDYKRRHYVLIGHYLKYDGSYAQEKLLKPSLEGFSKVTIDKNLRTDVTLYNIDEQPL